MEKFFVVGSSAAGLAQVVDERLYRGSATDKPAHLLAFGVYVARRKGSHRIFLGAPGMLVAVHH